MALLRSGALGAALLLAVLADPVASRDKVEPAERVRHLGYGYSSLHDAVSGLRFLDEALLFKLESEDTRRVMNGLADDAAKIRGELQQLAQDYPALSLDDDGLPEVERRKRKLVESDRFRSLAPVTGAAGADFERTLLLSQSGVLNQLRFLATAIEELEAEAKTPRLRWIRGVQKRLDRRYVEVVELLDRRFFCPPADSPTGAAGANAKKP